MWFCFDCDEYQLAGLWRIKEKPRTVHLNSLYCVALHRSINGTRNFLEMNKIIQFHFGRWTTSTILGVSFDWADNSEIFPIRIQNELEWMCCVSIYLVIYDNVQHLRSKKNGERERERNTNKTRRSFAISALISSEIYSQSVARRNNWNLEGTAIWCCSSEVWTFEATNIQLAISNMKKLH